LERESFFIDIQVCANKFSNISPVTVVQIRVSESHDNRHSSFELFYEELEFSLNRVGINSSFETFANLSVLLSLLSNRRCINTTELCLFPLICTCLPLLERVPHQMSTNKFSAQFIQVLEVCSWHVQFVLPVVIAVACFLILFKENQFFVKFSDDFSHFLRFNLFWIKVCRLYRFSLKLVNTLI
jgi:hypothetical protein